MDKKTETISFRCTPELEAELTGIAGLYRLSLSAYMERIAMAERDREMARYQHYRAVFGETGDLPGLPGKLHA